MSVEVSRWGCFGSPLTVIVAPKQLIAGWQTETGVLEKMCQHNTSVVGNASGWERFRAPFGAERQECAGVGSGFRVLFACSALRHSRCCAWREPCSVVTGKSLVYQIDSCRATRRPLSLFPGRRRQSQRNCSWPVLTMAKLTTWVILERVRQIGHDQTARALMLDQDLSRYRLTRAISDEGLLRICDTRSRCQCGSSCR